MASKWETALAALASVLAAIPGPEFARNDPSEREVPPGGRIDLSDGDLAEPEVYLSPLSYGHTANAEIVAMVQAADAAERDAALDALVLKIEAAVSADETLGGTVESVNLGSPERLTEPAEEGKPIKGARIVCALEFISDSPLG
ncbi:acyl-CoA transferase [Oleispirillum naphthae]|uniref:acyl-CoA transferase n=1 Tax=Oleispirillum naphthae TaxID=2838853 RepID=UPI003082414B